MSEESAALRTHFFGGNIKARGLPRLKVIDKCTHWIFILDIEVELIWGFIDKKITTILKLKRVIPKVRGILAKILAILDKTDTPVTWGILGHVILDRCKCIDGIAHPEVPRGTYSWLNRDWFAYDPCSDIEHEPAFYGKDIVDTIIDYVRESPLPHDVASHSFSHQIFGDIGCTEEVADAEVRLCKELLYKNYGIKPKVFIFPRDSVGHIQVLKKHGFIAFRGPIPGYPFFKFMYPPLVYPKNIDGLISIPASLCFGSVKFPVESLYALARVGLKRAALKGGIFHMHTHMHNFVLWPSEKAIKYFYNLLQLRNRLGLSSSTIHEVTKAYLRGDLYR